MAPTDLANDMFDEVGVNTSGGVINGKPDPSEGERTAAGHPRADAGRWTPWSANDDRDMTKENGALGGHQGQVAWPAHMCHNRCDAWCSGLRCFRRTV